MTAAGAGTRPCSTPITATAWNSRPFIACMVPARTALGFPRPFSETVAMPSASSACRASRTSPADRAATPIACGSRPAESHPRTRSAKNANSCARAAVTRRCGRGPRIGDRYPSSESTSPSRPVTGSVPSSGTAQAKISWVVR